MTSQGERLAALVGGLGVVAGVWALGCLVLPDPAWLALLPAALVGGAVARLGVEAPAWLPPVLSRLRELVRSTSGGAP
jgi:hypothetical protein